MKKFLFLFITILTLQTSYSQVKIRGSVYSVTEIEVTEDGDHKEISESFPEKTFFYLTNEMFYIYGKLKTPTYHLFDKDTTTINGALVISYISTIKDEMYLIAARESTDDRNTIIVMIVPFLDTKKYKEYNLRVREK